MTGVSVFFGRAHFGQGWFLKMDLRVFPKEITTADCFELFAPEILEPRR
jgi:hypothetical protein